MNRKFKKFWNWIRDENTGERILRLEGPIDEDQFWGDEITPQSFREELESEDGDVTLWINSPGGNVFAASQIYTMLRDYKGKITVKIDSIAASAASVVAMAGDTVLISPTGMIMVHDPSTIAMGNTKDMEQAITVLNEVKEAIINAYKDKTGLSHNKIAQLMSDETWMNAKKAVELGFADAVLFEDAKNTDAPALGGEIGEDPDEESAEENKEDEGEKKGKEHKEGPAEDGPAAHLFSARRFKVAFLNRIREDAVPAVSDDVPTEEEKTKPETEPEKPPAEAPAPVEDAAVQPQENTSPVMTLEGKTTDGSVPYIVLKRQLDLLR